MPWQYLIGEGDYRFKNCEQHFFFDKSFYRTTFHYIVGGMVEWFIRFLDWKKKEHKADMGEIGIFDVIIDEEISVKEQQIACKDYTDISILTESIQRIPSETISKFAFIYSKGAFYETISARHLANKVYL